MKILGFAGSNSSTSINKRLVVYAASFFKEDSVEIVDLNTYEMPLFSVDREVVGIPQLAFDFANKMDASDLLIISLAEHNGAYSAAFKNIFDWISRIRTRKAFGEKPILLMAASTGSARRIFRFRNCKEKNAAQRWQCFRNIFITRLQ